jgi:predicted peptidase
MRRYILLLALLTVTVLSCNEEDDKAIKTSSVDQNFPSWINGFPSVVTGATSIDLVVETTDAGKVYYVISDTNITLTPEELISEASNPTIGGIKYSGVLAVQAKTKTIQTIEKLSEHHKYFSYILAEPKSAAGTDAIRTIPFTTRVRQDTAQFFSQSENRHVNYLLYRPETVFKNTGQKQPIIIFLGGFGEKATAEHPINLLQNGLLPDYIQRGNDVPMMVMSIQHIHEIWRNELIQEGIDYALENFEADKDRIYLVGTSGGAFGVWNFAEAFPERIAAIVPISGGIEKENACRLRSVAVWAFTNHSDPLVPPGKTVSLIKAINNCSPVTEAKLVMFPDTGHNCWKRVFDKKHPDWSKSPNVDRVDIFAWLLQQSRNSGGN